MSAQSPRRATRPGEWVIAIAGGLALAGVLVWVLRGGEEAPVAVVASAPVAPVVVPAPAPLAPAPLALPVTADLGEYRLRGVLARPGGGGSAIIEAADGRQRLVRQGREVAPGVRLEAVNGDGVVLARGGTRQTLGFAGPLVAAAAAAAAPVADSAAARVRGYQLALEARRGADGKTDGYRLRSGSLPPILAKAGLRAGDVLLVVNDSPVTNDGRVIDLDEDLRTSFTARIIYERGGKQETKEIQVNKRE